MDWLDEKVNGLKMKIRYSSLRKAMCIYLICAVFLVLIIYGITWSICDNWKELILQCYTNPMPDQIQSKDESPYFYINIKRNLSKLDYLLYTFFQGMEKYSILIYSIVAIVMTSYLYYKHKLQEPLLLLKEEALHIGREDLSFLCSYDSHDEMGDICKSFNQMRLQLIKNQDKLWRLMEEQRKLNAAFAHDLRSPLTVMQGYTELLLTYYPQGKIEEKKLLEILRTLHMQINRMMQFTETMKQIHTFEERKVNKKKQNFSILLSCIRELSDAMQPIHMVSISISSEWEDDISYFDSEIIQEVIENLLSNALRYAKKNIDIKLLQEKDLFVCYIRDDGRGFTQEELFQASRPYYSECKQEGEHFGLGLTIAKLLCEKHGGSLSMANSIEGGAILCAAFYVK